MPARPDVPWVPVSREFATECIVFALKDAVYELVADAADLVPEFLGFSRMIDDLGLHTFETYAAAR
jgi:rsbT co-antagonist protein RsbR